MSSGRVKLSSRPLAVRTTPWAANWVCSDFSRVWWCSITMPKAALRAACPAGGGPHGSAWAVASRGRRRIRCHGDPGDQARHALDQVAQHEPLGVRCSSWRFLASTGLTGLLAACSAAAACRAASNMRSCGISWVWAERMGRWPIHISRLVLCACTRLALCRDCIYRADGSIFTGHPPSRG